MIRFYGVSPSELMELDNDYVISLAMCVDILEAREALNLLRIADYPMMKPESRAKLFNTLKKQANPRIMKEERKALSIDDIAKILREV